MIHFELSYSKFKGENILLPMFNHFPLFSIITTNAEEMHGLNSIELMKNTTNANKWVAKHGVNKKPNTTTLQISGVVLGKEHLKAMKTTPLKSQVAWNSIVFPCRIENRPKNEVEPLTVYCYSGLHFIQPPCFSNNYTQSIVICKLSSQTLSILVFLWGTK